MLAFPDWELLLPVTVTSLVAAKMLSKHRAHVRLRDAALRTLESLGFSMLFVGVNLVTGVALVLLARFCGKYVSLYVMSDASLLALSLVQGLLVAFWRSLPTARDGTLGRATRR